MITRDKWRRRNRITGLILLVMVACTPTATPTPRPQPQTVRIPTSTPIPTPLPQFATVTPVSSDNSNDSIVPIVPTTGVRITPVVYQGTISGQGDTVSLYNGPQGLVKQEVNNRAPITILGRSNDGQWLEIRLSSEVVGWVQASNVDSDGSMSSLQITGYVPVETTTPSPDAQVKSDADGLRLRAQPNTSADVLTNLEADSVLNIIGRNRDNTWLQVIAPNRQRGWVTGQFLDIYVDVLRLPVTFGQDPIPEDDLPASRPTGVITNITEQAQRIFDRGLTVGNRPNVFSKIGDSITVATWTLYPIGWGQQSLGEYNYLQPAIDYFSATFVRDGNNSFSNVPLAADNQWTTEQLLNPELGNPDICGVNETPLDCEYRMVRPSIALIMIGTNDVGVMDGATYRANLEAIMDKTIARSVLPILSTLPSRGGFEGQVNEFNEIIRQTAQEYQTPIWELRQVFDGLPNNGLDEDLVHPSYPPGTLGQWAAAVNFSGDNLNYGYNMRNLTAIQVLDAIWRQVILGE